ncbi:ATPase domain-containing protein [Polyangium aurulentum]|uniref:ATPase domain-containing protein n=1 Tax=Polyangium aurulentum TaxID=2567896 RepID=UPI0010AEE381|nr:ATPase domain-containing protein [Polyangium aurulentum]UQA61854.1 recombinase RecA [Polyangium aurulentum]
MSEAPTETEAARVSSGIDGLDTVLQGGFIRGGIYIVSGRPGAGKTILANQTCFRHVAGGGRATYVTLLSEMHDALLTHMSRLSFFDRAAVGSSLVYINGYTTLSDSGLEGLLKLLRDSLRAQGATLLIVDGLVTAEVFARSDVAYKRFIQELQTWVGLMGITVLLLASTDLRKGVKPEHTMVDGILELRSRAQGQRWLRELKVTKLRGSAFLEGRHAYRISSEGISLYPRFEALYGRRREGVHFEKRISIGIEALDELMGGGVFKGSTTLMLGPSGSGKTVLGLHFLHAGAAAGEPALCMGFAESPETIRAIMKRLGMNPNELLIEWQPAAELLLDAIGYQLIKLVEEHGVRRLLIDGIDGLSRATSYPERVPAFFTVLVEELCARGVTTLITDEARELFAQDMEMPGLTMSAICDNSLTLRQVQTGAQLNRLLSILKTSASNHSRGLFEFDITDRGIVIGQPLRMTKGAATAVPVRKGKATKVTGSGRGKTRK